MNIFEKSSRELASNTDAKAELAHPMKWVKALALLLVLIIPSMLTVNSYAMSQSEFANKVKKYKSNMKWVEAKKKRYADTRDECNRIVRKGNCEQYKGKGMLFQYDSCRQGAKGCSSSYNRKITANDNMRNKLFKEIYELTKKEMAGATGEKRKYMLRQIQSILSSKP